MEPKSDGSVIGFFAGEPITAAVIDYFGRRYTDIWRSNPASGRSSRRRCSVARRVPRCAGALYCREPHRTPEVFKKSLRLE
jgi:hypothetical protein